MPIQYMIPTELVQTRALSPVPAQARRELQALLESTDWPGDTADIVLAVHEALINAQRHAGGATSAVAAVQDERALVVEVRDEGPGFDVEEHARQAPDPLAERGRGLWLITQIAAGWEVQRQGRETCLRLRFQP
ncbi:MAG: ATP-binding protein [Actinomycetota bacterium]|nr:ATP-binding protein [Actinomycetota bacterium]